MTFLSKILSTIQRRTTWENDVVYFANLGKGGLTEKNLKDINIFSPGGGVSCPQKGEAMKANEMLSLLKAYKDMLQPKGQLELGVGI